jgi:integrase/recombinase XerD
MENYLKNTWSLKNKPTGPLVEYLKQFVSYLIEQGYNRQYIQLQYRVAAKFSDWLLRKNISESNITEKHLKQFIKSVKYKGKVKQGIPASLHRLFNFLQQVEVIKKSNVLIYSTPLQQTLQSYSAYLLNVKGLSNKSIIQYSPFIERFLAKRFGKKLIDLSALSEKDIINFIKQLTTQMSAVRVKVAINALRSFLRYAAFHGEINASLINAVPTIPAWSMSSIPKAISLDHIQVILKNCPRDSTMGKRDYAILMLLVHLGLRAIEIVGLTLESIDWKNGTITIQGKGGRTHILPLLTEVGEAIADYLQHGRPTSKNHELFLRTLAPFRGLGAQQTVATIVNAAIRRAGVGTPTRGSHQFRHALATNLIQRGASLKEIGDLLGHQHPKTTNIYAKVNLKDLRSLSLPWLGVV